MSFYFKGSQEVIIVDNNGLTATILYNGLTYTELNVSRHEDLNLPYVEPVAGAFVFLCSKYEFKQASRKTELLFSETE